MKKREQGVRGNAEEVCFGFLAFMVGVPPLDRSAQEYQLPDTTRLFRIRHPERYISGRRIRCSRPYPRYDFRLRFRHSFPPIRSGGSARDSKSRDPIEEAEQVGREQRAVRCVSEFACS